jgi:pilus assembly protein CpaE
MSIFLLTSEPFSEQLKTIETKLTQIVPELRKIEKIEDVASEIKRVDDAKALVVFVSTSLTREALDKVINIATRYHHRVFFILVTNEISAADYKRLIRSGGAEWVDAKGSLEEIRELIHRQNLPHETRGPKIIKPTVISFLPCMGGVGNTTIALEIALHIKLAKTTRHRKICYVDFDFQTSHVCDYLDIEARLQIDEILDRPERLDEQLFELFVSRHACGLDVFAAPRTKLALCDIDAEALDPLLRMIADKYEFIVLDLPVPWFSWTGLTLENSDAVVLTGINTIPCLRQMRSTLDAVVEMKSLSSPVAIVMNRVRHNLVGRIERRRHVESVFPNENIFYIEENSRAVERVNTGTPARLAGNHGKAFAKLALYCSNLRQTVERERAGSPSKPLD